MKKKKRVSTGIKKLDALIDGGYIKNSVTLITGGAGTGKTIFAIQFLVDGITKHNEAGMYITFEEKKEKLYNDMLKFGWDLKKFEKQGKLTYLQYTPEQVQQEVIKRGGILDAMIPETKIKRLVIDSITSFALLYKDELKKREDALSLFDLINKWDITAVLTAQVEAPADHTISATLEFEVDGIIKLYHIKKRGIRERAFEILKMRGTKIPEKTMELAISNKEGIKINPKKLVIF